MNPSFNDLSKYSLQCSAASWITFPYNSAASICPVKNILNFAKIQNSAKAFPLSYKFFKLYFDRYLLYILVPNNICFKNAADTPLFCGEDLNFCVFSKFSHRVSCLFSLFLAKLILQFFAKLPSCSLF
jgi:hypothetical protein